MVHRGALRTPPGDGDDAALVAGDARPAAPLRNPSGDEHVGDVARAEPRAESRSDEALPEPMPPADHLSGPLMQLTGSSGRGRQ